MLRHAFKKDYSGNTENKLKGVQEKRWGFRQLRNNRGNYNNPWGKTQLRSQETQWHQDGEDWMV